MSLEEIAHFGFRATKYYGCGNSRKDGAYLIAVCKVFRYRSESGQDGRTESTTNPALEQYHGDMPKGDGYMFKFIDLISKVTLSEVDKLTPAQRMLIKRIANRK